METIVETTITVPLSNEMTQKKIKKFEYLNPFQKSILETKYCHEKNSRRETMEQAINRVAEHVNKFDPLMKEEMTEKTIEFLMKQEFSPAGGIWRAAGNPVRKVSAVNCTTQSPVRDSIEDIWDSIKWWSRIASYGQGNGIDISGLRPRGSKTANCAKTSTGAVSFLKNYHSSMETIGAENRRGATKPDIWIYHPDSQEFISCKDINTKEDLKNLSSQNISIKVDDAFMEAVEKDKEIEQRWARKENTVYVGERIFDVSSPGPEIDFRRPARAKQLFDQIAAAAWKTGEPGIEFWSTSEKYSNSNYHPDSKYHVVSTNGCFAPDTMVTVLKNKKDIQIPIIDVKIGDFVKSFDRVLRKYCYKKVLWSGRTKKNSSVITSTIKTPNQDILLIHTPDHLFRSYRGSWKSLKEFKNDDFLISDEVRFVYRDPIKKPACLKEFNRDIQDCKYNPLRLLPPGFNPRHYPNDRLHEKEKYDYVSKRHAYVVLEKKWKRHSELLKYFSTLIELGYGKDKISDICGITSNDLMFKVFPMLNLQVVIDHNSTNRIQKTSEMRKKYQKSKFSQSMVVRKFAQHFSNNITIKTLKELNLPSHGNCCVIKLNDQIYYAKSRSETIALIYFLVNDVLLEQEPNIAKGIKADFKLKDGTIVDIKYSFNNEERIEILKNAGVEIIGPEEIKKFHTALKSIGIESILSKLDKYLFYDFDKEASYSLAYIKEVGTDLKRMDVYDITVEDTHCFFANNVLVHNCSEQKLDEFGTCILASINLYKMPIYEHINGNQYPDWRVWLEERVRFGIRFLDNVVEMEYQEDRSPHPVQKQKLRDMTRIGLGFTGMADWFIKNQIVYGSAQSNEMMDEVMRVFAEAAYRTSIELGKERGSFREFDKEWFTKSEFVKRLCRLTSLKPDDFTHLRHVCSLSVAPTGTLSYVVGAGGSGVEPLFAPYFERKERATTGDYQTHYVFDNCVINECKRRDLELTKENVDDMIKGNEWVFSANVDPLLKIDLMSTIGKYIDSGISVTYNLPKTATIQDVKDIYLKAWKKELKSVTVYRDGSREGILTRVTDKEESKILKTEAPKRPVDLPCDIHQITVKGEKWIVLVGLMGKDPYEIFCGAQEIINLSPKCKTGKIVKAKRGKYDLILTDDAAQLLDIKATFKNESGESALTRLISVSLRHGVDIKYIVQQLEKVEDDIMSFAKAIGRVLKKYIADGTEITGETCPTCGSTKLVRQSGCMTCTECCWSKC